VGNANIREIHAKELADFQERKPFRSRGRRLLTSHRKAGGKSLCSGGRKVRFSDQREDVHAPRLCAGEPQVSLVSTGGL